MLMALLEFLDAIPTWMTEWWFLALMAVILIGLIVVYFVIKKNQTADED